MKIKVAIVCNSKNPDLVQYFKCKVESVFINNKEENFIFFKNSNIELKKKNVYNSSYTDSSFFDKRVPLDFIKSFYLLAIMLNKNVKIIHFTTAHISNLFLSFLLKPFNIKQIFTIHDLVPHPGGKSLLINLYNKVVINFLSDEIISFSKKEIEKQEKKKKFVYFPLSGFHQYIDKPKMGERTILFFGRIEPYKGISNLIDLITKIENKSVDYKFIIAGKGKLENVEELKKFNNLEIINRFISDNELNELFTKATFTILPYDSATQSGVTILSYAYATPVIAYDVGALGEYIDNEKNGYLVNYQDNDKIIDILTSISDDEIKYLSNTIINEFDNKFSINACQQLYYNYYINKMENKND